MLPDWGWVNLDGGCHFLNREDPLGVAWLYKLDPVTSPPRESEGVYWLEAPSLPTSLEAAI